MELEIQAMHEATAPGVVSALRTETARLWSGEAYAAVEWAHKPRAAGKAPRLQCRAVVWATPPRGSRRIVAITEWFRPGADRGPIATYVSTKLLEGLKRTPQAPAVTETDVRLVFA